MFRVLPLVALLATSIGPAIQSTPTIASVTEESRALIASSGAPRCLPTGGALTRPPAPATAS